MQSKLEDVLKEKERELKLHERFLNLKRFCEEEVFPFAAVPLQRHVERLKGFVERLIPEPKDRTEELFSGEIFTLLCVLYFHDIGVVSRFAWSANEEILSRIDSSSRTLLLNQEIARRLDIPESAIELVNAIIFSPVVKKIPTEWEIVEGPKKAIVRNARMLEQIVGFAHLLWDIFSVDSGNVSLRRFQNTNLRLRCGETRLAVDGREGLICIRCKPEVSYQYHALEEIKALVEDGFTNFKNHVNGRLGFQYRELSWEIDGDPGPQGNVLPMPQLFPFTTYRDMPFKRWGEASQLLDKLFHFGYVMVVGEANTGKTTLLNSFVIPQLQRISFNVFYAEIWESPVSEVRDAIKKAGKMPEGSAADIVSMAAGLAQKASCFFILDGCERLKFITGAEKEKLERFVDFCLGREDAYIIAVGDKEEFFDWYRPFERMSLSALFETRELEEGSGIAEVSKTEEPDLIPPVALRQTLDEVAGKVTDWQAFRELVAALADIHLKSLRRYSIAALFADTCIPHEKITAILAMLKEKGIVRESLLSGTSFFALSSRQLKEPLYEQLDLSEFDEKRRIREALKTAVRRDEALTEEALELIERWKDRMLCNRDHMGLVLASIVVRGRDPGAMLKKVETDHRGVNAMPLLRLLEGSDEGTRARTLDVLAALNDDVAVNTLLDRMNRETVPELRVRMAETIAATGKRNAILALMNLILDPKDAALKHRVLEQVAALPGMTARELLLEMGDLERDPETIDRIDQLLAMVEET